MGHTSSHSSSQERPTQSASSCQWIINHILFLVHVFPNLFKIKVDMRSTQNKSHRLGVLFFSFFLFFLFLGFLFFSFFLGFLFFFLFSFLSFSGFSVFILFYFCFLSFSEFSVPKQTFVENASGESSLLSFQRKCKQNVSCFC